MKNIGIIGLGYVGLTTAVSLAEVGHKVIGFDVDTDKMNLLRNGKVPIYEPELDVYFTKNLENGRLTFSKNFREVIKQSDVIFICVGTPFDQKTGTLSMIYVEQVARDIALHLENSEFKVIVDKSTVPVKTAGKVEETIRRYSKSKIEFPVVSNPEFLQEGKAMSQAMSPDRIVIGSRDERASKIMQEVYQPFIDNADAKFLVMR
ncbi:MAG: UDP-glucose/GDP-mannose dehydrogenase family protein, partial [Candidatus Heimdallarchaeota archaeon]|nr:UDP-glucose/GDP-mannose dehydrogenase family protein [Candidatus Heimdallarchaeota archaeon]